MTDSSSDGPSDDSNPRFVVTCDDCGMGRRTDDLDEAVTFAVKHRHHTGHSLTWERSDLVEHVDIPERVRWRVSCPECETKHVFRDEDAAEGFRAEHEQYAGHTPPEPERLTLPRLEEVNEETVANLVDYCFESAESVDVVPSGVIVEALAEAGLTPGRAADELVVVESEYGVYERGDSLLARQ